MTFTSAFGERDRAPELIRGSQGSGCDRPAFDGPKKRNLREEQISSRDLGSRTDP